ncbi:MAG TPA: hypothetical protein VE891_15235 [Allosphingosinicella sp.]|nr:hypothetical protein [Allosphingosinicella sp.]
MTGNFKSRTDLTRHVWAMHRLQMFPNLAAIARECGTSVGAIGTIIAKGEGRDDYLARGCPTGG